MKLNAATDALGAPTGHIDNLFGRLLQTIFGVGATACLKDPL